MFRTLIVLLMLALPPAVLAAKPGIPLWEGAETGMSLEQVLQAFPGAAAVPREDRAGERGPQGGELKARIERVEVAGAPYGARFFFDAEGLARIVLDRRLGGEPAFSRGLKMAGQVRDALTEHYGEPVKRQTGGEGYLAEWRKGDKRVRLVVVTQSYRVKAFQVVFEPVPEE